MYLSKICVKNYKSFRDSGDIEFKPGINIIVGQNNSGKTALLEAFEISTPSKPNVKLRDISKQSQTELTISISSEDTKFFPDKVVLPQDSGKNTVNVESLFNSFFSKGGEIKDVRIEGNHDLSDVLYPTEKGNNLAYILERFINAGNEIYYRHTSLTGSDKCFWNNLFDDFANKTYRFKAERPNLGVSSKGVSTDLDSVGSLLAQVLLNLQSRNRSLYDSYIEHIRQVLPSIKWVSSFPIQGGEKNETMVWTLSEKEEDAIPLSECGTGIGQVLAILYVVVTSKEPRIILIDEPNSFLHPAASKKLIQILNEFPQHQYFISTHSPEIVTASIPATITMLRYEDGETKIEQIDLSNADGVKSVFKDLGIEPATFAFANHILWVEGPTEAESFKLILKDLGIQNIVIKPTVASTLRQTGARFQNVRHIFNLHKEISGTNSVISPNMTILLDREIGKERENADLVREFGEKEFNFIPRAMYENYLIDAEAITSILLFAKGTENYAQKLEIITNKETPLEIEEHEISVETVSNWIQDKKDTKEFLPPKLQNEEELSDSDWLINVDGAKLLDNLFKHFLGKPFGYEPYKIEYGQKLTQWFLENKSEQLKELQDFLLSILKTTD